MAYGELFHVANFGDWQIYQRGDWRKKERLPLYIVSRKSTRGNLNSEEHEFKTLPAAIRFTRLRA